MKKQTDSSNDSRMKLIDKQDLSEARKLYVEEFGKLIKELETAMGQTMTQERGLIYFEHLAVYPIEEVRIGIKTAIHEETFSIIPPVGKIVATIERIRKRKAEDWPRIMLEHKERFLSPEESKDQAARSLKLLYDHIGEIEEKEQQDRKQRWIRNKERLQAQKSLVLGEIEKGER